MSKNLPPALPNMQQQWDVSIYKSTSPRNAPDVTTPAKREAVKLENTIRHNTVETGAFFRADGTLITQKAGTVNQVRFDQHELVGTARSLFTHNHPDGLPFSRQDVEFAVDVDLTELRAVTAYCRFVLRPEGAWPTFSTIEQAILQHGPSAQQEVTAMVHACQLSNGDIPKELQHRMWVLVSNDLKLGYVREDS